MKKLLLTLLDKVPKEYRGVLAVVGFASLIVGIIVLTYLGVDVSALLG